MKAFLSATALTIAASSIAHADVTLPAMFTEHMVLQRDKAVPVWGWADKGEEITVSFAGQSKTATAGGDGTWKLALDAMPASAEPRTMTVKGAANEIGIIDILVGEVWICSGQSNMAWTVNASRDPDLEKAAGDYPQIRQFLVPRVTATAPQDKCEGDWVVCAPDTVGNFTASGYFFGRELHRALGVPVGLINTSWGGTRVEAWTSKPAHQAMAASKPILDQWDTAAGAYNDEEAKAAHEKQLATWKENVAKAKEAGKRAPRRPAPPAHPHTSRHCYSAIYNAMIAPLIPYAIKGAIWYQGESNSGRAYQYRTIFPGMISDWRKQWSEDFPFLFVQLAGFKAPQAGPGEKDGWIELQEAQTLTLSALENTGMACINDVGEAKDIHPKNKQDVGKRLARWALHFNYGKADIVPSGPLMESYQIDGDKIRIRFKHAKGLKTRDKNPVAGFEIAGEDKQFVWADAKIEGDTVIVSAGGITEPKSARYAWAANPVTANLVNGAGLPTSVLRTDDWEETTVNSVDPGIAR